ncbi:MAG: DUF4097 family beta strand repeat-containing protein [Halanaeroarchaeum sp.]
MNRLDRVVSEFVDYVTSSAVDGTYSVAETETRHFDAAPELAVAATNGSIEVRSEDRADVVADVTWRARNRSALDSTRLVAAGSDDEALSLAVERDSGTSDVAVDLSIVVPETTAVGTLQTINGSITLADARGAPTLSTKNGSITVDGVDGALDCSALNGEIAVRRSPGVRSVETKNGAIDVELLDLRDHVTIRTTTGRIDLALDPSVDVDLVCETNLGSIDAPVLHRSSSGIGTTTVAGTLGNGGPELFVEANVGSIEVTALESGDGSPGQSEGSAR